jgi:SurA-like N-terminal domain
MRVGGNILRRQSCYKENDANARCESGRSAYADADTLSTKTTKSYLFVLFLIPVIAMAGAFGYYKFILPEGVAAVVNGEVINLTELDAAVARFLELGKGGEDDGRIRYRVLDKLIRERLMVQEACKVGINVTAGELAAAVSRLKALSGLDQSGFNASMIEQYGSAALFETEVKRGLLLRKLMNEKAERRNNNFRRPDETISVWLHGLLVHATVRIALSEEWPDTGGGCGSQASPVRGVSAHTGGCPMTNKSDVAGRAGGRH